MYNIKDLFNDFITYSHANAGFTFVIYFALLSGLFNREYQDQTLEFLDALPTTRYRIFVGKLIAAWWIVVLSNLLDMGVGLLFLAIQDNALLEVWDGAFLTMAFVLRLLTGYIMIGWAVFFSLWRSFGWLVFALLMLMYLIVSEAIPEFKVLNFLGLGAHDLATQGWHISWSKLTGHLVFATCLYGLAYLIFLGVTDRLNRLLTVLRENRMGAAFLVLLSGSMVFALGVVGIIAMSRIAEEDPTDKPPARFTDWSTATASTKFFDAVYLADRADLASPLLADADELHEGVRKFFAADPGPKIFLDMSGGIAMPVLHFGTA